MQIQYSITFIGTIEVPNAATNEEIEEKIYLDFSENEPNDIKWEEAK